MFPVDILNKLRNNEQHNRNIKKNIRTKIRGNGSKPFSSMLKLSNLNYVLFIMFKYLCFTQISSWNTQHHMLYTSNIDPVSSSLIKLCKLKKGSHVHFTWCSPVVFVILNTRMYLN